MARADLAEPLASRAAWALLWLGLLAYLLLAPPTLHLLGIPYQLPYGPMPAKIHPGTWLVVLSLGLGLVARGNPMTALWALLLRRPLVGLYLACMVYTGLWSLWRHGTGGAAFFVDTLWMPGIALLAMAQHPRRRRRALGITIAAVLVLNAAIALAEHRVGRTLIPQTVGYEGILPDAWFRASALFGHPLANALITASLLPLVWRLPLRPVLKAVGIALLLLSLLAYGGRTAVAAVVLIDGLLVLLLLGRLAMRQGLSYAQWLGGVAAAVLAVLALGLVLATTDLGERIFANLTWDNSANVRLVVWQALDHLDAVDWWIGVSPQRAESIAGRIGLDLRYEAIENFWIAMLMQVGLLGFIPFVAGLLLGTAQAWRAADWPMRFGIVLFFLVGSGANTLTSKTIALLLLFMACEATRAFQPRPAAQAALRVRTRPFPVQMPMAAWRLAPRR